MTPMPPPPIEIDQFKQPCGRSGVDDHKITGDILVWYCRNGDAYSMNLTPQNVKR